MGIKGTVRAEMGLCNISLTRIRHPGFHQPLNSPIKSTGKKRHFVAWKQKAERKWLSLPPAKPVPGSMTRCTSVFETCASLSTYMTANTGRVAPSGLTANNKTQFSGYYFSCYGDKPLGTYGSMTVYSIGC